MLSASEKGLELKVLDSEDIESGVVLVILVSVRLGIRI